MLFRIKQRICKILKNILTKAKMNLNNMTKIGINVVRRIKKLLKYLRGNYLMKKLQL